MPNIGFAELIMILVLALIVFGPKKLPEIGRTIGKSVREFRRASQEIRAGMDLDLDDEPPRVPGPGARPRRDPDTSEVVSPGEDVESVETAGADAPEPGPPGDGARA